MQGSLVAVGPVEDRRPAGPRASDPHPQGGSPGNYVAAATRLDRLPGPPEVRRTAV